MFELLQKAHANSPDNKEVLWRLARAHFDKAELLPKDKRQPILADGLKARHNVLF